MQDFQNLLHYISTFPKMSGHWSLVQYNKIELDPPVIFKLKTLNIDFYV